MTLKIGITGGIGAGKTTIAQFFQVLQIPIYNADDRAKWLMNNHPELNKSIIKLFGREAYIDQVLNRRFIAQKVFDNQELLAQLNAIVHPAVAADFESWCLDQHTPYVLKEAALLYETGAYKELDRTINVSAPIELRAARVMLRDPERSKKEIQDIMDKQWSEEKRMEVADYVIINDGSHMIIPQVLSINEKLKSIHSQ